MSVRKEKTRQLITIYRITQNKKTLYDIQKLCRTPFKSINRGISDSWNRKAHHRVIGRIMSFILSLRIGMIKKYAKILDFRHYLGTPPDLPFILIYMGIGI